MKQQSQKTGSSQSAEAKNNEFSSSFLIPKRNYKLLLLSFLIVLAGFLLMLGSSNDNPEVFNEDIYSFRRIGLSTIFIVAGLGFAIYAIMVSPKGKEEKDTELKNKVDTYN